MTDTTYQAGAPVWVWARPHDITGANHAWLPGFVAGHLDRGTVAVEDAAARVELCLRAIVGLALTATEARR